MKEKKKIIFTVFSSFFNVLWLLDIKDEYSSARLETIFYSFESKEYDRNSILYSEEEPGDVFFIIQRGEVTLSKQFLDESKTPPSESVIYICTLGISYNSELPFKGVGHLLGEEILTNKKGVYENTAVVTS
jgi:CRP-like cAMP-binding protein